MNTLNSIKVCIVVNCSSINYIPYFLESYNNCIPGYLHDLIIVHRNYEYINISNIKNTSDGNIIYVNKILEDNTEIPHRAFGSYKYVFNLYKDNYDMFIFMVDHCVIRRDNWINDAVRLLFFHKKIAFLGSQIFNGHKKYPHPTHVRTPCIIVKTDVLVNMDWQFNSDHEGEMNFGDMIANQGYIGIQIGNKLNYAYDSKGDPPPPNSIPTSGNIDHITHYLEKKYFNEKKLYYKYSQDEFNTLLEIYNNNINNILDSKFYINSIHSHINIQHDFIDIEPFDKLIYHTSLNNCYTYLSDYVKHIGNNIFILDI
jgi:hypothetical protein